jgi:hypothetical protein
MIVVPTLAQDSTGKGTTRIAADTGDKARSSVVVSILFLKRNYSPSFIPELQ